MAQKWIQTSWQLIVLEVEEKPCSILAMLCVQTNNRDLQRIQASVRCFSSGPSPDRDPKWSITVT